MDILYENPTAIFLKIMKTWISCTRIDIFVPSGISTRRSCYLSPVVFLRGSCSGSATSSQHSATFFVIEHRGWGQGLSQSSSFWEYRWIFRDSFWVCCRTTLSISLSITHSLTNSLTHSRSHSHTQWVTIIQSLFQKPEIWVEPQFLKPGFLTVSLWLESWISWPRIFFSSVFFLKRFRQKKTSSQIECYVIQHIMYNVLDTKTMMNTKSVTSKHGHPSCTV